MLDATYQCHRSYDSISGNHRTEHLAAVLSQVLYI